MTILNQMAGLILAAGTLGSAHASSIAFSSDFIAASDWRYHYTITNDSPGASIHEFTVYFDRSLYTNLAVATSPANWDAIVIQPDLGIPADGFFDALALTGGIGQGSALSGYSVRFTYLGQGTPGAQPFDILDEHFAVIDSGITRPVQVNSIPEPGSLLILVTGLVFLLTRHRR